ncbi:MULTISPECIES: ATP-binding cassette domain-containing protein [Bacilli]|jgi:putative ABC transport system ATP-binding protein|uniref:ATP-binding cassette domain-containing protein n=2 Tax=Carnobacterium TaxID=2747 RepID=A0ABR7TDS6_9LACT|nr:MULTISPECIES: ATP-binding cassette domain-containing protein [Bacilli]AOA04120.1 spermidine/putrescine ABC transporter ATP-binding protein [Carnobacterium maltaromaticum]EJB2513519.1 ATP-binding cassette domain-containing protein [Listeria monocytogenes]EJB2521947.1 ATP-binding cassette domain-containing protein [Listeria monocytogenes]EJB2690268.1 ATP-binding cassette domain-containing protein [Listeria monocytogenes]EJE4583076.1 ATP-binding cassette domain-containing protein [Listeria mon
MEAPLLKTTNLEFEVDGKTILKGITLTIEKGDFLTITGPSGSGKSTLLKIIASMLSPTEGKLCYQNKPVEEYEPTDYRKEVSYCFQTATLFGETVKDNLTFPYDIRNQPFNEKKALSALKSVGLGKEYLTKSVHALSGGEKQRVALIRNILFMPKVLLLDEVTSALDEENQTIIRSLIRNLNQEQGITIVWVTHNTVEIQSSNRIVHLVNGEMEEPK